MNFDGCLWGHFFDACLRSLQGNDFFEEKQIKKTNNGIIVLCQGGLDFPGKESVDGRAKLAKKTVKNEPIDFKESKDCYLSDHDTSDTSTRQPFLGSLQDLRSFNSNQHTVKV